MSLYLPEQKLGSHSQPGSSSHKFMLKGRQTGSMHRGHSWVFRAESYDTMMAWYEDIKNLTERTGEDRNAFVRRHTRSVSAGSVRSVSGSELDEDEADEVPYSANASMAGQDVEIPPQRPSPGGRFPSDVNLEVNRHLQPPLSPSSGSSEVEHDLTAAGGSLQGYHNHYVGYAGQPTVHSQQQQKQYVEMPSQPLPQPHPVQAYGRPEEVLTHPQPQNPSAYAQAPPAIANHFQQTYPEYPYTQPQQPLQYPSQDVNVTASKQVSEAQVPYPISPSDHPERPSSQYRDWMAPMAGVVGMEATGNQLEQPQHPKTAEQEAASLPGPLPDSSQNMPPNRTSLAPIIPPTISKGTEGTVASPFTTTDTDLSSNPSTLTSPVTDTITTIAHPPNNRQYTDVSVSDLHVPGEYPKRGSL
jgi:hypothetical protein